MLGPLKSAGLRTIVLTDPSLPLYGGSTNTTILLI